MSVCTPSVMLKVLCSTWPRSAFLSTICISKPLIIMIIKLDKSCPDYCHRACVGRLSSQLEDSSQETHLGQTGCCICHRLLRGSFRLLMKTLLGHTGCTLSGQHLMKYWSSSQECNLQGSCRVKSFPGGCT